MYVKYAGMCMIPLRETPTMESLPEPNSKICLTAGFVLYAAHRKAILRKSRKAIHQEPV